MFIKLFLSILFISPLFAMQNTQYDGLSILNETGAPIFIGTQTVENNAKFELPKSSKSETFIVKQDGKEIVVTINRSKKSSHRHNHLFWTLKNFNDTHPRVYSCVAYEEVTQ